PKAAVIQYYHFLAREVVVAGSDQDDVWDVDVVADKNANVAVHTLDDDEERTGVVDDGLSCHEEIEAVVLQGMGDQISCSVRGDEITPMRIRIVGGPGNDIFDLQSINNKRRIYIYDSLRENNHAMGHGFRNRMSNADTVHKYDRSDFKYNKLNPGISLAFNN